MNLRVGKLNRPQNTRLGLLLSGGLDSAVLLGWLLAEGYRVRPFYVRSGLFWEEAEQRAVERLLEALRNERLEELIVCELPLRDVYADHWSVSGLEVPGHQTPDDAVYLPGRNPLLAIKPVIWCGLNGIDELALGVLSSNPFRDARPEFFAAFETALEAALGRRVRIVRPFAGLSKREVMLLGRALPLELTFSCIAPIDGRHCGRCNKCAERQKSFQEAEIADCTVYAATAVPGARQSAHCLRSASTGDKQATSPHPQGHPRGRVRSTPQT